MFVRKDRGGGRKRVRWTEAEDATLRSLYPDNNPEVLAQALPGRTYSSLITRAHTLGVGKSQKYLREAGVSSMKLGVERYGKELWEKPIGATYDNGDRTLVKVASPDVWRPLHNQVWEQANGPIPEGLLVVAKDGNLKNVDLQNLCLRTFSEHVVRCCPNYRHLPEEIVDILHLQNEIKKEIKRRKL
ncbi:HNH endonuclease [Pseudomonas carnis]|uniref:HNH endonuclease n=1 Tax=Pseudomonas carnis TaxID=2487355 RepID=UPI0015E3D038|nr:HNH endonuclease [Pseudomonas carnis]MBA1299356.1 HNH endonuclease [Pseudomonas carnis]